MKTMDVLADLRNHSKLDQRVKYDGHNRRPVALSRKRLARRRSRRRGRQALCHRLRRDWHVAVCRRAP